MKLFGLITLFATNFLPIFTNSVFADWHSWKDTPKRNQMYMQVHMIAGFPVPERQTLIVTRWDGAPIIPSEPNSGWWDAESDDINQWFNEGSKVIYLPGGKDSMEYLQTSIKYVLQKY